MKEITIDNEKIFSILKTLKQYPLMVIVDDSSYQQLQNYIEGFVDGLSIISNLNLRISITKWYESIIDEKIDFFWSSHIPIRNYGKSEVVLKEILIDITEQYFKNNPDWYKNDGNVLK
ncbi:MAG: hypothetical protein NTW29_09055 [Bacteroidetes bacterium]|nr:hypothetical protein [Bacteroidota bacterium]